MRLKPDTYDRSLLYTGPMARSTTPKPARSKRAMNPLVTLRAQTVPNKKRQASKLACRTTRKDLDT